MLHIPSSNLLLLAAIQEPYKKAYLLTKNIEEFSGKSSGEWTSRQKKKDRTESVTGLSRWTSEEIVKCNQMTALRSQTGGDMRHPGLLSGDKSMAKLSIFGRLTHCPFFCEFRSRFGAATVFCHYAGMQQAYWIWTIVLFTFRTDLNYGLVYFHNWLFVPQIFRLFVKGFSPEIWLTLPHSPNSLQIYRSHKYCK